MKSRNKVYTAVACPPLPFKMHLTNKWGLHSNIDLGHHHLEIDKRQLLFFTETQIWCPADAVYLSYPGYNLEHCVYVRDDICVNRLKNLGHRVFDICGKWKEIEIWDC